MKKKTLLMAIALMCFSTIGFADTWNGIIPSSADLSKYPTNDDSKGTQTNPFEITSAADLAQLSANVKAENSYAGKYFKLMTDIDLNNGEWYPIGTGTWGNSLSFKGNFDGNNHVIKNLSMAILNKYNDGMGLFGKQEAGSLSNLRIEHVSITANGNQNTGALVGNVANITITNCSVSDVNITSGNTSIGGMIGKCWETKFIKCYATGITLEVAGSDKNSKGGLIGNVPGGANSFTDCYAANVTLNNKPSTLSNNWGTLAGAIGGDGSTTFSNCYADITICGAVSEANLTFKNKNNEVVTITDENKTSNELIKTTEQFASGEVAYLLGLSQDGVYPCSISDKNPTVVKAGTAQGTTPTQLYAKGTAILNAPVDYTYIDCTNETDITTGTITGITQADNKLMYLPNAVTADWQNNVVINGTCVSLVLKDGYDFVCPIEFTATNATYTRNFAAGWNTFCLPFPIEKGNDDIEELVNGTDTYVQFDAPKSSTLPANTPYLINITASGNKTFSASGVTIPTSATMNDKSAGNYTFKACISPTTATSGYGLVLDATTGKEMFKKIPASGLEVPSFRAYLDATTSNNASLRILHKDGATEIASINAENTFKVFGSDNAIHVITDKAQNISLFSIDGRLVKTVELSEGYNTIDGLLKGIYLINKQKVAVK